MDRPIYENENPQWIVAENNFRAEIEQITGFKLEKIPRKYGADFCAFQGNIIKALVEIKCRDHPIGKYASLMISLHKIVTSLIYAQFLRLPLYLWIKWTDRIGYIVLTKDTPRTIGMGTNGQRDDPADYEICCFFSNSQFTLL